MKAGDTFIDGKYHHLWIVLSDPELDPENVVIVNFTSHSIAEQSSCTVQKGEHPFVKHKTVVRFEDARLVSLSNLETLLQANLLTPREHCSPALLKKLREGAATNVQLLPEECRTVLDAQGFI